MGGGGGWGVSFFSVFFFRFVVFVGVFLLGCCCCFWGSVCVWVGGSMASSRGNFQLHAYSATNDFNNEGVTLEIKMIVIFLRFVKTILATLSK